MPNRPAAGARGGLERDPRASALDARAEGRLPDVVRRAPFADSPHVGARGQRTRERILDAAVTVFGEAGYEQSSIDQIAKRAGCSRAAFYQYFSGKDDVFRQLAGRVARLLNASTEALEPLTPGKAGWLALRAWISRFARIHDRYEPVFHAFQAAAESDDAVATGSARWRAWTVSTIRSRMATPALRSREVDAVILQLLECVTRAHDVAGILRSAAPGHFGEERLGDALADVVHRCLFGLREDVNVHGPPPQRPPVLRFDPVIRDAFAQGEPTREGTPAARRTREALLEGGRKVLAKRGYYRTRVADLAEAAGVSRAAFYRYFESKDELARALTTRAMQAVSRVLAELPASAGDEGPAGGRALRGWLRRYNLTQVGAAAMIRVWVDAALEDATLRANAAPALDWGRRAMVSFLERRGFGDVETEAVVLLALLSEFGARKRTPPEIGAAARIIERGLLCVRGR